MSYPALLEITSSSRYGPEVLRHQPAEIGLCRPVRRSVVVGQVEVGDAEVERPAQDGPLVGQRIDVTEVLPEPSDTVGSCSPLRPTLRYGIFS